MDTSKVWTENIRKACSPSTPKNTVTVILSKKRFQLENRDAFLARLRKAREDSGKTQAEVARLLGVSQATYGRWENGVDEVPIGVLPVLAKLYGISVDWLLTGQDVEECVDLASGPVALICPQWIQGLLPLLAALDEKGQAAVITLLDALAPRAPEEKIKPPPPQNAAAGPARARRR